MEHAPLPYRACNNGDCQCKMLWSSESLIATITNGKWGDDFPVLKVIGTPGSIEGKLEIEAVMDQVEYGEVSEEAATATIKFIVHACNNHYKLLAALRRMVSWADNPAEAPPKGHTCGPEGNCDCGCVAWSHYQSDAAKARCAIANAEKG